MIEGYYYFAGYLCLMEKQDLLLLHGALGSKDQFQSLIPLLEVDFEIY